MNKKLPLILIVFGMAFLVLATISPGNEQIKFRVGFSADFILSILDRMYFVFTGLCFLISGSIFYFKKRNLNGSVYELCVLLLSFSLISIVYSFIFNILAMPLADSKFRLVTFFIQSLSRLLNPGLNFDFFIALAWLISMAGSAIYIDKYFSNKTRSDNNESSH